ncbi:MAG TPA: hypothetical protein VIG51_10880 [Candidatus Baltobacteraceae bacterium]|jgi:uncharacterized membrane protein YphA (DoxX/SURF4 family)
MLNSRTVSNLGSHVYGLAAVALGIIGLVWGDFATVWQPIQAFGNVPHREALAYIAAVGLLASGVAIQWRRTTRAGAVVLIILNLIFALFWVPRVVGYPGIYGTWGGFFQEFALVPAAVIVYASCAPRDWAWALRTTYIARLAFGICAISFGIEHFTAVPQTAAMVPAWIPPGQHFWAVATGICFVLAGAAILSGVLDLLASRLLTLMLVVFGAVVWAPSLLANPHGHMTWAGNAVNLAMIGAAWTVADSIARSRSL